MYCSSHIYKQKLTNLPARRSGALTNKALILHSDAGDEAVTLLLFGGQGKSFLNTCAGALWIWCWAFIISRGHHVRGNAVQGLNTVPGHEIGPEAVWTLFL